MSIKPAFSFVSLKVDGRVAGSSGTSASSLTCSPQPSQTPLSFHQTVGSVSKRKNTSLLFHYCLRNRNCYFMERNLGDLTTPLPSRKCLSPVIGDPVARGYVGGKRNTPLTSLQAPPDNEHLIKIPCTFGTLPLRALSIPRPLLFQSDHHPARLSRKKF